MSDTPRTDAAELSTDLYGSICASAVARQLERELNAALKPAPWDCPKGHPNVGGSECVWCRATIFRLLKEALRHVEEFEDRRGNMFTGHLAERIKSAVESGVARHD